MLRVLLLLPLLLLGSVLATSLGAREEGPVYLPVLKLPTLDGEAVATSDFRGRPLLLVEFASW